MTFPRRYFLLLIIGGFALFFWSRSDATEPPPDGPLQTVEGTITAVERKVETGDLIKGRRSQVRVTLLTLREHPNVEFSVLSSSTGIDAGVGVRVETYDDVARSLRAAKDYPNTRQRISVDSLTAGGTTVYTAAEAAERASGTRWGFRIASLVCWAIFLTWAALAVRRHLPALRRKLDEKLG